jgi:SAM-dependent methyltransferase
VQPDKLHLIDPWYLLGKRWPWASTHQSTFKALRNILYWFEDDLANGKIVLHVGFDEPVLQAFPDKYFDWVYLDTTHEEEHTRRELEILGRKVKDGGLILGDDWFEDPGHMFHGQLKAIQDFCQTIGAELKYASNIDHQWALRLPAR